MTMSGDDYHRPGASGSVRFVEGNGNQWRYNFVRSGNDQNPQIYYRKMDGATYTGYTAVPFTAQTLNYPAVAGPDNYIGLFWRGLDNQLYVAKALPVSGSNALSWSGPQPLGGIITAAPTAACLINPNNSSRTFVFVRGTDNQIYMRYSDDGYTNFQGYFALGNPPGGAAAAPVATITKNSAENFILSVFAKSATDSKLYITQLVGSGNGQNGAADFTGWNLRGNAVLSGPADGQDYPVVMDVGVNFISPTDPQNGDTWSTYQRPGFSSMAPQLAKFNMFYDNDFPIPHFNEGHLNDAISNGAYVIILRTADSRFGAADITTMMNTSIGGHSILDYIRLQSNVAFWIQVGNEPDRTGMSKETAASLFLDTLRNAIPNYRPSVQNLRWMASMPTYVGGPGSPNPDYPDYTYLDYILENNPNAAELRQGYDAMSVTHYGNTTLFQQYPQQVPGIPAPSGQDSDKRSCGALDRVLAFTKTPVFVTEAGVNSTQPWFNKIDQYYVPDLYRMPSQVRGYAIYSLTRDPKWAQVLHYGVDVDYSSFR